MVTHMRKTCKIAPREGNSDGMEKLYEYTLRKQQREQEEKISIMQAQMDALKAQVRAMTGATGRELAASTAGGSQVTIPYGAAATKYIQSLGATNIVTGGTLNAVTNVDNSVGKTTNNITINVFGKENLGRVTKPQIFDVLRGLGPIGDDVKALCEKAIIKTAMLIFSDPAHPEDITCYLPNKKGDDALVHGEAGWEVQPVGLVISPMATKAIDALFAQQPAPDTETPTNDVKWMMDECGRIMRYLAQHEGDLTNEPPRGEMRGILIRNKDLLQQVLAKLPMVRAK